MSIFSETELQIGNAVRTVRNRFNNMIRRAVITLVDDSLKQQELQLGVMKDEQQDGVEHFEHYGIATSPPIGSEAVVVRLGGAGDVQAVIATAFRTARPKLAAEGDVTIWDLDGQKIELKRAKIVITLNGANTLELGAGATKGVNREGDDVGTKAAWDTWFIAVGAGSQAGNPPANPIASTGTGSGVVKAVD